MPLLVGLWRVSFLICRHCATLEVIVKIRQYDPIKAKDLIPVIFRFMGSLSPIEVEHMEITFHLPSLWHIS